MMVKLIFYKLLSDSFIFVGIGSLSVFFLQNLIYFLQVPENIKGIFQRSE